MSRCTGIILRRGLVLTGLGNHAPRLPHRPRGSSGGTSSLSADLSGLRAPQVLSGAPLTDWLVKVGHLDPAGSGFPVHGRHLLAVSPRAGRGVPLAWVSFNVPRKPMSNME